MPQDTTTQVHDEAARIVTSKVIRWCGWLGRDEVFQQAYLVTLEARANFDPERGELRSYLISVAYRNIARWACRMSSPVRLSSWALSRADRQTISKIASVLVDAYVDEALDAEQEEMRRRWVAAVKARVRELLASHQSAVPELIEILLDEHKPREVAARLALDISKIYNATQHARRQLRRDATLTQLWSER